MKLTAVFQKVPEGYIAFVEELTGANTAYVGLRNETQHSQAFATY